MKKYFVIFITLLMILNIAGKDRWGSSSSYSSGLAIGTSRSVGVDPNGGYILAYDANLLKDPQQGERTGIAVAQVEEGKYLFDFAQCEDTYFPNPNDELILMFSKTINDANGTPHGYYGAITMYKDDSLHDDKNPEPMNDIVIYEIPHPTVKTDRKYNYITWKKPIIQPIGNQVENPIKGYKLYCAQSIGENPHFIADISYNDNGNTVTYTDSLRSGYYYITLITGSGVEIGSWDMGPDGRPGYSEVDDNNNGMVDELAELGMGDDQYHPTFSAPSNYVDNSTGTPSDISDLSIVNSDNKIYLQWTKGSEQIESYNIYRSLDGGTRYYLIGNVHTNIFFDLIQANYNPAYYITSVTYDGLESQPSNKVDGFPYEGAADSVDFSNKDSVLFPEWSHGNLSVLSNSPGIAYFKASGGRFYLMLADINGNRYTLVDDLTIYWASTLSWGDYKGLGTDSCIYFTAIDNNHTQIFVQKADPGNANDHIMISQGWGNWTDPSWADSLNQVRGTQMVACSVDGDIYVFNPDDSDFSHGNLIPLTDFYDPNNDKYGDTPMCFQPKWSPDNTMLAFVVRHPENPQNVATSDIYIVKNVQELIKDIDSNGTGYVIKSLSDIRLEKTTETNAPDRFKPIWSPSWSEDKTMISYVVDVSNRFNNYDFQRDYDRAMYELDNCNFDAYIYERGIGTWPLGMPPMASTNLEGFVKWSPSLGDVFAYVYLDFSSNEMKISHFSDPTIKGESSSTKLARVFENGTNITISDRAYTSITLPKDIYYKYGGVGIYPIIKVNNKNIPYIPIGVYRKILVGGAQQLNIPVKVRLHYTRFQAKGMEENFVFPMRYDKNTKQWETLLNYKVIKDENGNPFDNDNDGGFIDIETDKLGLFGLFSSCPHEDDSNPIVDLNRDNIKIGPNPASNLAKLWGANKETLIKIYDLNGELIASSKNRNSITWVTDHWEWVAKNDSNLKVASGLYIVTLQYNGKTITKKLAIIH